MPPLGPHSKYNQKSCKRFKNVSVIKLFVQLLVNHCNIQAHKGSETGRGGHIPNWKIPKGGRLDGSSPLKVSEGDRFFYEKAIKISVLLLQTIDTK
jgi:hypothetical protein